MMKRTTFGEVVTVAAVIAFALIPLLIGLSQGQDELVPVEGKKNRDKHVKPVEPVTPAPAPHVEPIPDPNFTEVEIEKRPKPRPQPKPNQDRVDPISPSKPTVIHKGSWSSWFGGLCFGIVTGVVGAWASTLASVRKWIGI